jgi:hypothetical protein
MSCVMDRMWRCICGLERTCYHDLGRRGDEYTVVGCGVDRHDDYDDLDAH